MTKFILRLYDYICTHRMVGILSFILCTVVLVLLCLRVEYREDISDFLSLDSNHGKELRVFQDISGADKIFVIFQYVDSTKADVDVLTQSIDEFVDIVTATDTARMAQNLMSQVDIDMINYVSDFIYKNIPYFLTEEDYARIDSLLVSENYVEGRLSADKQMLMFPSGGFLAANIQRDPLNIFTPVLRSLQSNDSGLNYEMYDGYIFSPDMRKAIIMMDSPFGSSESENNAKLLGMLKECASSVTDNFPNTEIHITGGPVIAVGNSTQIKKDSILAGTCAMVLILALLFMVFRKARNLLLIALSICWGWLFGFGCLSLVHHNVSIIVLGISSVVIGIAVNYPLHLLAHLSHTTDKRTALKEIVAPLLVGNITTVGAFLALVPLHSVALRDLGLFSSFLLIGTIVFVLLYLPHIARGGQQKTLAFFSKLGDLTLENKPYIVWLVVILTVVFGYFSLRTKFDSNISHINYMTREQKEDMAYFATMMRTQDSDSKVYVLSSGSTTNEALEKSLKTQTVIQSLKDSGEINDYASCSRFICSEQEQERRLRLWDGFILRWREFIRASLSVSAASQGFADGSFDDFLAVLDADYQPVPFEHFSPLVQSMFSSYFSFDEDGCNVVNIISVEPENVARVEEMLGNNDIHSFDVLSMNSALANSISNDFNYIGWACGCIVFFFLWLSMGSIELAILSFIPMAISWLWILGLMAIFGVQFNIVNIILATFIFGQGDDYTIFMTEGSCFEYAYRRKILGSYKNSIVISALIMFIAIGTLILSKHPAMRSLGEVTVIGMLSVVLMDYLIPPLIYKWLVGTKGKYRLRPLSLGPALRMVWCVVVAFFQVMAVWIRGLVSFGMRKEADMSFRKFVQRLLLFDLRHIPGVQMEVVDGGGEDFSRPVMVVSNSRSVLDSAVLMAVSPRLVFVSDRRWGNAVVRQIFRWLGFVPLNSGDKKLRELVQRGYSLVVVSGGCVNSSVTEFPEKTFAIAERLNLDIVPIVLHGTEHILPKNSLCIYRGKITVSVGSTMVASAHDELLRECGRVYGELVASVGTTAYYRDFLLDRYRYKGNEIFHAVKKKLRVHQNYSRWLDSKSYAETIFVVDTGFGEFSLLCALMHPSSRVVAIMEDDDKAAVLKYSAEGILENLQITDSVGNCPDLDGEDYMIYLLEPTEEDRKEYSNYKTTEII